MVAQAGAQDLVIVGGLGQQVRPGVGQVLFEAVAGLNQGVDGVVDVLALDLEGQDALAELGQRPGVLGGAIVADLIEVQDFADLLQGEADALAAQDQLQAGAVTIAEQARPAAACRVQQAFLLVEAQCAGLNCYVSDCVPRESDLGCELVTFLPLDSPAEWAESMLKTPAVRASAGEKVAAAGYEEIGFGDAPSAEHPGHGLAEEPGPAGDHDSLS